MLAAAIYFASWAFNSALIYGVLRFIGWIFVLLELLHEGVSTLGPPEPLMDLFFGQVRAEIVGIAPIRSQLVDERMEERWASSSPARPCRSGEAR